ncbi:hypothetical protein [Paenibacillus oleatilyticus]|uniref:hypothetical protein n=1 Tax=Paenibacillus oleatilyticus TaxID=2594886 RepID=UPI001C1F94F0|nr:hypothetical protein [Paenibacillus oleatilyticus]MBU7318049.1 hypothetical protein [Paenibacillus oleatilyticus]
MRRYFAAALLLIWVLGLIWPAGEANALSCARQPSVNEEFARSTVVFHGKAVGERKNGATTFEVTEAWKGVASDKIDVLVSNMWMPVQQGEAYLVYAAQQNGVLTAHLCGRTALWEQGRADTASFPPTSVTPEDSPAAPWSFTVAGAVVALIFAVLLASLMIARRRDPKRK